MRRLAQRISPRRAADLAALALAFAVGALVASTLASVRYVDNPDEAYYLAYAGYVGEHGLAGLPQLFHDYASEPARWRFPNPLRVGYIGLATGWTALRGTSFAALSELSLVCHVLVVLVAYRFLRGLQGHARALLAAALVAFSPLQLALARRALIDGAATLTGLLVLWSFVASLRHPGRRGLRALFALAFGAGIVVKETGLLLALPCAIVLAWERFAVRRSLPLGEYALALLAPPAVCAALWLWAAGDLSTLVSVVRIILSSPASNDYALQYGGGPWYRYVVDELLLAPWPTLCGIAAIGWAALRARERQAGDAAVWLAAWVASLWLAFAPFTKNVRYVAQGEIPLRALAVALLCELCATRRAAPGLAVAAAVVIWWSVAGWIDFERIFVTAALYDPMTAPLLMLRGLAPGP
jgi:4-amino-4-deoxy-L-arabinose transferase-like glycosyltransferase